MKVKKPPVFLNPFKIRLPLPGIVSIMHRITGVLLFLAIPASIYMLDLSTRNVAEFERANSILSHPLGFITALVVGYSLVHHLFAGLRYLLIDMDIGVQLSHARKSALAVVVLGIVVTFLLLWSWL